MTRRLRQAGVGLAVALSVGCVLSASAQAAPPFLWQAPEDGLEGSTAGRVETPRGLAKAPNGDLLVADLSNSRIDELDVWGQLVRSFGWGVVASGPDNDPRNERQELSVNATGGSFALRYLSFPPVHGFSTESTAQIPAGASAAALQSALEGLVSLEPGDVAVTGSPGGPWTIEFAGNLADADVPALQPIVEDSEGNPTLTGGAGTATVDTLQTGANAEVCVPANGDVCRAGQPGAAPGQLAEPNGVAVDASGDVYVDELASDPNTFGEKSLRVQKFDPAGHFLLMVGGEVDKTTAANLCTEADVEGGDVCGAGKPGAGEGQFAAQGFGTRIAIGPEGKVFVGDAERIERFTSAGAFDGDVKVPGEAVSFLAMNGSGDFYAVFAAGGGTADDVRKLSPAGALLGELPVEQPSGLAVDATGDLYAVENPHEGFQTNDRVVEFSAAGALLVPPGEHLAESNLIGGLAVGSACGIQGEDLYVSHLQEHQQSVQAYGSPPDPGTCPPPLRPPTIADQFVASVDPEGAVVRAAINPHFWPDAEYFVEYGTGKCSEGGCPNRRPTGGGSLLTGQTVNAPVATAGVFLPELEPGTTYHYRFVAESGGGGPVRGLGGEVGSDGAEGAFHTGSLGGSAGPCPNDAFRTGLSAILPDCRAYEMVSPVDKEGGDIAALGAGFFQAATQRGALSYSSYRSFGGAESAPYNTQYLSTRAPSGWTTHPISPPRGENLLGPLATLQPQFKLFSPDLCEAWVRNDTSSLLAPQALSGFATFYRRQNCEPGIDSYTTIGPLESTPPKYRTAHDFVPKLQGVSADGVHAIFRVSDRLTDSGPDLGAEEELLYDSFAAGKLRMVCVLPNGTVVSAGCSAGTPGPRNDGTDDSVSHAISDDGSRIFWSDRRAEPGKLYVRVNGKNPTIQITTEPARFWTAAADGSRAIYTIGSLRDGLATLDEFDVGLKATTQIAPRVAGVLGAGEDASRVYFVSNEALGAGAEAGAPNLYLYESGGGGQIEFIAILSKEDAKQGTHASPVFSPVDTDPAAHVARVTADGETAVFMSDSRALAEETAGYDNTDVESGESDGEVYRYDAAAKQLDCISCNPSGARPSGHRFGGEAVPYWAAARIQPWKNELYAPRVLSANGKRVFFESYDPLVREDTDGRRDVYEWEAPGEGACSAEGAAFVPSAGGCLGLVSSGASLSDASFLDASADGSDVYLTTSLSLLPQDPGLVDVYDARVDGGFPAVSPPRPPCEGEACQSPPSPPSDPTPASATFEGAGNPRGGPAACAKGRRRSHGRCVPNRRRRHAHRSGRRAGR